MIWIRLLAAWGLALTVSNAAFAASATKAHLVLPLETVRPGDRFLAGLQLTMKPGWHTYWRNGGDSGAPTSVQWDLPAGWSAGPLRWPAPERYDDSDLVTYVYHGTVTLLAPIEVPVNATPGPVEITAAVRWLECEKLCVPGQETVSGKLIVGDTSQPSNQADRIRTADESLPRPVGPDEATAAWDGPPDGDERTVTIRWKVDAAGATADFFPFGAENFEVATATTRPPPADGRLLLRKTIRKFDGAWPTQLDGLLVLLDPQGHPKHAREASLPLGDSAASIPSARSATSTASISSPSASAAVPGLSLARALGLALLGGLILNVMPCVLPVIALKILSFVRQSGSRPAEVRRLGIFYTLGVWFSFLVLAGIVIGVKQAAGVAGWGMQFGNPVFLVAMTTLILLVSLSLFGVFEINFSNRALDRAGDLAQKEGTAGAFFNGMLATALATPCTAPFLAPALGYAFAQSTTTIVLVFTAVALGLASPYLILSWQPAWLKFLPKPGAWMEHFKVAMGFPMLAAALWLYSIAATRHFGEAGPLWLGLFLLSVALAAWIWGQFVQRGRRRQALAMGLAAGVLAGAYFLALEHELHWRSPRKPVTTTAAATAAHPTGDAIALDAPPVQADTIRWLPWSSETVDAARRLDRPVLVDFTADWCLTCQRNERAAINVPAVRKKLLETNAIVLKGDHTLFPPAITQELQRFGRAGVPLVLVYPRDPDSPPVVLPEWLSPEIVLQALDQAAQASSPANPSV